MTDSFKMYLSYYDMACTGASVAPVVNIENCVAMKRTVRQVPLIQVRTPRKVLDTVGPL
jgi:hypothetical protein